MANDLKKALKEFADFVRFIQTDEDGAILNVEYSPEISTKKNWYRAFSNEINYRVFQNNQLRLNPRPLQASDASVLSGRTAIEIKTGRHWMINSLGNGTIYLAQLKETAKNTLHAYCIELSISDYYHRFTRPDGTKFDFPIEDENTDQPLSPPLLRGAGGIPNSTTGNL